jgi:hypothetical protein
MFYSNNQSDERLNQLLDSHQNENFDDYVERYRNILTADEFLQDENRTDIYYERLNSLVNPLVTRVANGELTIGRVIEIIEPFVRFLGRCGITAATVGGLIDAMVPILGMIEEDVDADELYDNYLALYGQP